MIGEEELELVTKVVKSGLLFRYYGLKPGDKPAMADTLERELRDDSPDWRVSCRAVQTQLQALLAALQAHFGRGGQADAVAKEDAPAPPDVALLLDRLDSLLAADDPEAIAWLDDHAGLFAAALAADHEPLAAALRQFDFPQALAQLRRWRADAGAMSGRQAPAARTASPEAK